MKILDTERDIKLIWKDKKRYFGMPISFTTYAIIEKAGVWQKLFMETGLLHTFIEEIHIYRIDDITVFQNFFDKIFGVGKVIIHCKDASCGELIIKNVKKPYHVRALLNDMVENSRREKRIYYGEMQ